MHIVITGVLPMLCDLDFQDSTLYIFFKTATKAKLTWRPGMTIRANLYQALVVTAAVLAVTLAACSKTQDDQEVPASSQEVEKTNPPAAPLEPEPSESDLTETLPEASPSDDTDDEMDVIAMTSSLYETHTRGIVMFTHEKHYAAYQIGCGQCHHDDTGNPLDNMALSDPAKPCSECHSIPGLAPKTSDGSPLSTAEKLAYHAEAVHMNCIDCHREHNTETGTRAAPASCTACHPREK